MISVVTLEHIDRVNRKNEGNKEDRGVERKVSIGLNGGEKNLGQEKGQVGKKGGR